MAVTWNPADKSPDIALSNGGLTATDAATSGATVRATASLQPGAKTFWSCLWSHVSGAGGSPVGFANASASLGAYIGFGSSDSVAYYESGQVRIGAALVSTLGGYAAGDVVDIAYDDTNKTIWFRTNGGAWNGSGSANPSSNTGGFSTSATNAGPYFPAVSQTAGDGVTANFGGAAFTYAQPAGFRALEGISGLLSQALGPIGVVAQGGFAGGLDADLGPLGCGARLFKWDVSAQAPAVWTPAPPIPQTWSPA